jgi:class 3 adenylate cyclase
MEIILATPMVLLGDVGQVEDHLGLFGDSVNLGAR